MRNFLLFMLLSLAFMPSIQAQKKGLPIDIIHYNFTIHLNDSSNLIRGKAIIHFLVLEKTNQLNFDLVAAINKNKGMKVLAVQCSNLASFEQEPQQIKVSLKKSLLPQQKDSIEIAYEGIPADGLIIGNNKYGKRGFFADNWPNRASNWLPCVDHPADKATVDFHVIAPSHYKVVANGFKTGMTTNKKNYSVTHYREKKPLPTKVMVIGVADFAVEQSGKVGDVPVYSWVYPENRKEGFYDYALAVKILPFFQNNIGPYGYEKLANVQSKTRFGGLENASTIFYSENSVKGNRSCEALLAHEIAHQWFGNMATEKEWAHIWLSEGFATYMTLLYMEYSYGKDTVAKMLQEDRRQIIAATSTNLKPVVDKTVTDYMELLNTNSYQKGGWVLHMLRQELGDVVFWDCLKNYYRDFTGKNADTEDFQKIIEKTSGKSFASFFKQWLYMPGHPKVHASWKYDPVQKKVFLQFNQLQTLPFEFDLEFLIKNAKNKAITTGKAHIKEKSTSIEMAINEIPNELQLDPNGHLLFEEITLQSLLQGHPKN